MMHRLNFNGYESDQHHEATVAFYIHAGMDELTSPIHQHHRGQSTLTLHGVITCTAENALWMMPLQYAVWIPGGMKHSNQMTASVELCFSPIKPSAVTTLTICCILKIPSLCRESILALVSRTTTQRAEPMTRKLIQALFGEPPQQPQQQLHLPISSYPKTHVMVKMMVEEPIGWGSLEQWVGFFAVSEHNLTQLIVKGTGLGFHRWRQRLQLIMALQRPAKGDAVQEAAHTLGYGSTTTFITMPKKGLG